MPHGICQCLFNITCKQIHPIFVFDQQAIANQLFILYSVQRIQSHGDYKRKQFTQKPPLRIQFHKKIRLSAEFPESHIANFENR